jgi:phage terminase large subunit-like protein
VSPVRGTVLLHEDGPALWPDYVPLAELESIHRDVGTPIFRTMYQAEEGGLSGEIIDREFFRYGFAPKRSQPMMAVDPAIGKKASNDETAIIVANVVPNVDHPADPFIFVRWVWAKRGAREREKRDVIMQAWTHYKPVQIGVEAVAYQTALVELLGDDYPMLPVVPVTPDADKLSRFLALGALYEFGRIVHHPTLQATRFEDQLVRLPHGKHDDMADALAYIASMAGYSQSVIGNRKPRGMP